MKKRVRLMLILSMMLVLATVPAIPSYAAGSQSIYVLTKVSRANEGVISSYKYDKNGLIKTASTNHGMFKHEFKYDRKGRVTQYRRSFNDWATFDYTYDKKGRIKKTDGYYTFTSNNKFAYDGLDSTYTYSGKRVTKEVVREGKKKYTNKFTYNKKGQLTKAVIKYPQRAGVSNYTYDGKGNLLKIVSKGGGYKSTIDFRNTYSGKRLTKQTQVHSYDEGSDSYKNSFKYKKIKVPAKYVKAVKAQQWAILNEQNSTMNLNFAFPRNDYNGM